MPFKRGSALCRLWILVRKLIGDVFSEFHTARCSRLRIIMVTLVLLFLWVLVFCDFFCDLENAKSSTNKKFFSKVCLSWNIIRTKRSSAREGEMPSPSLCVLFTSVVSSKKFHHCGVHTQAPTARRSFTSELWYSSRHSTFPFLPSCGKKVSIDNNNYYYYYHSHRRLTTDCVLWVWAYHVACFLSVKPSSGSRGGGGGGARGRTPPPPCRPKKKKEKKKKEKTSVSGQELLFPNVLQVLKLLLVTPVTTASVERANSALGFVKSDHRSTMPEGRLNALLRLYVHKDTQLDFEEVVTAYGHKHPRRMLLGWPLNAWFSSCWTSSWSSWSSQWLQILCKYCEYYVQITLKIRSLIFLKLYPKIVKNAYLRIAIFKISRGSMPPDPLEGARASPRRDRYAITSFGVLEFHAPPPPPRDSNPGSATETR